jgi:hypothetical protein
LAKVPPILKSKTGTVTIPENDESSELERDGGHITDPQTTAGSSEEKETSAHTEIQWLLLKLGNDMGLDIWVARKRP